MFEAYSIGIRVSLINGVTAGLIGLARQFKGADQDAKGLQKSLDRIAKTAAIGVGLTASGAFGLGMVGKAISISKEYANQLSLLNQLGMSQRDIAAGVGAAWKTAYDVPTTKVEENIKTLRELRSAFGPSSYQESEARMVLPMVQRVSSVLTALTGKEQNHVGFDLVKATELRTLGGMTPEAMNRNIDLMSRTLIAMGGTITAQDFHGTFKMGKMATGKWSDEFAYLYLPTLMQELKTGAGGGAQSAGTILMSLYQQMHGKMTKAAMPLWVDAGLVKSSDIVKNATGQYQVRPGGVAGTALFEQDPYLWVQKYLRPGVDRLMATKGITAETAINAMFSNRNAAFGAYTFYAKSVQFERDRKLIEQSRNSEGAYQSLLKTNPMLAEKALQTQLHNQLVVFGYSVLPDLLKVLTAVLPIMRDFTAWIHEHGKVAKFLMGALVTVSSVLLVGGALTSAKAAFEGLGLLFGLFKAEGALVTRVVPAIGTGLRIVVGAITSLAGVLGWWTAPIVAALAAVGGGIYFIAKGWERDKSGWTNIRDGLGDYWKWLSRMGHKALDLVHGLENPGDRASPGAKAGAFWLKFFHGVYAGARDAAMPYVAKIKTAYSLILKSWDPTVNAFVSGVSSFISKLKVLAGLAHQIMPWAFSDPSAKPGAIGGGKPKTGLEGDIGRFGREVGRNTIDALVGTVMRGYGVPLGVGVGSRKAIVPSIGGSEIKPIHTTVQIDGRTVAKAVSYHQERDLDRANRSSGSAVDARRSLLPVGISAA